MRRNLQFNKERWTTSHRNALEGLEIKTKERSAYHKYVIGVDQEFYWGEIAVEGDFYQVII